MLRPKQSSGVIHATLEVRDGLTVQQLVMQCLARRVVDRMGGKNGGDIHVRVTPTPHIPPPHQPMPNDEQHKPCRL